MKVPPASDLELKTAFCGLLQSNQGQDYAATIRAFWTEPFAKLAQEQLIGWRTYHLAACAEGAGKL